MISVVEGLVTVLMNRVPAVDPLVTAVVASGDVGNRWPLVAGRCVFLGTTTVKRC